MHSDGCRQREDKHPSGNKKLKLGKYFIGGHPMAGSEKSGYTNSKAMLIENAYYILTPGEGVAEETFPGLLSNW